MVVFELENSDMFEAPFTYVRHKHVLHWLHISLCTFRRPFKAS